MQFYSTNNIKNRVSFKKAVLQGLSDDNGLYMPEEIPQLANSFIKNIKNFTIQEISFEVAKAYLHDDVSYNDLKRIVFDSINFDTPLIELNEKTQILELSHGPTLAFKDFGARFMARLTSHFLKKSNQQVNVLVATSGDTGSAVANGFLGVENIKVIILYPKNGVSQIQEKQLTTLGQNITAIEVKGTFDDCQRLVKTAFLDPDLQNALTLTSANSINIARLLPQMFYYFNAYARLVDKSKPIYFSVPCGNFGNLTAGLIAKRMGLPVEKFIAATNINKVFPDYLESGKFEPRKSVQTISNAMDVGNPSNFSRMLDLYGKSLEKMRNDVIAYFFTDEETQQAMKTIYEQFKYRIDPHGAVAYLGFTEFAQNKNNIKGIILETAHPAKFYDTVKQATGHEFEIPEQLAESMKKTKNAIAISENFEDFKNYLLKNTK